MDRNTVLEFLRMFLIAFVIAMGINLLRVLIFEGSRTDIERSVISQIEDFMDEGNAGSQLGNYHNRTSSADLIDIPMAPLEEFSYMSREDILNLRKIAIAESPIFSDKHYSPSPDVFRIEDGLPWISADAALHWSKTNVKDRAKGVTRDSIGILNPELLYFVSLAENEDAQSEYKVLYKDFYFMPYKVTYIPATKTIVANIKNDRVENGDYQPIHLADSNAHDLGYKYAYMDHSSNVGFYKDGEYLGNYLKSGIKETTGYFMRGSVCGIPGGCNNYAPYWQYYNSFYLKDLPATVHIKLWKNYPASISQEADINFEMVFE